MARALTVTAALLVAAPGCVPAAQADSWAGDARTGTLGFSAMQAGARFTGRFEEFSVALDLDDQDPGRGRLLVTVATASADTQDDDRDDILRSEDFFWSARHPQAVFRAEGFERDGAGYRASGTLTLRGVTRSVVVRFTAAEDGGRLAMKGASRLMRLEFGVGRGDWADTEWIGDEVGIAFDLRLRPAAAGP